jgi:hypothetical protein
MGWKKETTEVKSEVEVVKKQMVVTELPHVAVRTAEGEDGTSYSLVTVNEALQEIRDNLKVLLERTK